MATQDEPEQESTRGAEPGNSGTGSDAMSQRLAIRIEQDVESPLPWRSIAKKTVVVVAGITIYLVFPSLTEVFDSWPKLTSLDPVWFLSPCSCRSRTSAAPSRSSGLRYGPRPGPPWPRRSWQGTRSASWCRVAPHSVRRPSSGCSPPRGTTRPRRSAASPPSRCWASAACLRCRSSSCRRSSSGLRSTRAWSTPRCSASRRSCSSPVSGRSCW